MTAPKGKVRVKCGDCGRSFWAARASAKFCSSTCRSRARRGAKVPTDGELVKAVRADLGAGQVLDSWAGRLAITLAQKLEAPGVTGVTSLSAQLRAAMHEALGPRPTASPASGATESSAAQPQSEIEKARDRKRDALSGAAAGR